MAEYNVIEKFESINGEGTCAGQLATFIRFKGCNLNCSYCDTAWANCNDTACEKLNEEQIIEYIRSTNIKNVTLTGGEPLLQPDIDILLNVLTDDSLDNNLHLNVEIETNGSIELTPFAQRNSRLTFTMDYKLPSSGMERHMCHSNFNILTMQDTVKFVSGSRADLLRAKEIIDTYDLTKKCNVYISPVFGSIEPDEIIEFMKEFSLNDVNLQIQLHKIIWDPQERGV